MAKQPKWITEAEKLLEKTEQRIEADELSDEDRADLETFRGEAWLNKTEGTVPDFIEKT